MIEIPMALLVVVVSLIIGLGVIIWATRDALAQEERAVSKLANTCTELRASNRELQIEVDETNDDYADVEIELAKLGGRLRKSFDHIELAKLERDNANDDFEELDEITTSVVTNLRGKLDVAETNLLLVCLQRDTWRRLYAEREDELELVKLERDEARDLAEAAGDALYQELEAASLFDKQGSSKSDVAPKRKRLAS